MPPLPTSPRPSDASRRRWLAELAALSAGVVAGPAVAAAATGGEIRLGASAALSGPAASLGRRFHAGSQAAFAHINHQGGIHTANIVLDVRDDAYEPERAEANTRMLLDDARTLALFGYVGTPTSMAVLPLVKRAGIAFVGAYTGADFLREPQQTLVFNVRASYSQEGLALARAMKDDGVKTVDLLYQADLFGRAGLESMRNAASRLGLHLGMAASHKRNSEDMEQAVGRLLAHGQGEAIFMVSTYGSCAAAVKLARSKGFRGRFYVLSFTGLEPLRQALGPAMKGLTMAQVVPDAENRQLPVVADYQQAMRAHGDSSFDAISLEGYIAARVMAEGLRRARLPLSRASVAEGLGAIGSLDLGGFRLTLSPQQRQGSDWVELRVGK